MSVHYKFKSSKEFDTLALDGVHISLGDLKEAIIQQKRLGKGQAYDLKITNAETKEVYTDEKTLVPKNSSLIVARVPIDPSQMKKPWETKDATALLLSNPSNLQSTEDAAQAAEIDRKIKEVTDLTKLDGSEEDKIITMMAQSTLDYHPSRYVKLRNSNMAGNVPKEYKCYKCHQYGHWVSMCPLNNQDLRKSTGIPSKFLKEVTDPNTPGVMITPTGKFVISLLNAEEDNEDRPTPIEKPPPSEELLCSLCKELMRDAVIISCCTDAFCDDCIRNRLLDSEEHECPSCKEKGIGPDTLIPTRYLRIKCMQYDKFGILVPSKMERGPLSAIPQYVVRANNTPTPPRSPAHVSNVASPKSPSPVKSPVPPVSPVISDAIEEKDVSVDINEAKPEKSPAPKAEEDSDKENKDVQPQSSPKTTVEPVEETPKEEDKEDVKDDKKEENIEVEEPQPQAVEETVQQRKPHKKKKKQKHSHSRHHEEDDEGGGGGVSSKGRRRKSRQSKEEEDRYSGGEDLMDKAIFMDRDFRKSRSRTPSPSRRRERRRDRSEVIRDVNPNPRNNLDDIYESAAVPEFNPNVPPPSIVRTPPKDQFYPQPPHMPLAPGIPPRPPHAIDDGFRHHHPPVPPPVLGHPPPTYPPQVPPYREMEVVDDPLAAFQKHLREKDERDRLRKARKRSYSRSPSPRSKGWSPRYPSRSRSRPKSFSRSPSHNRSTRRASPFTPESSRRRWSRSPHDSPKLASSRSRRRSRSRSGSYSRQRSPSLSSSPGSTRRKTSPFTVRPIYRDPHSPNSNRSRPADEWRQHPREEYGGNFRGVYPPPVEDFYQQPYGDRFEGHPRFGKQGPEQAFDGRHYNGPGEFDGRGRGMRGRRGGDRGGRGRGRGRGGPPRLMDEMPPQPIVPHPPHQSHPQHPPHQSHPPHLPHPSQLPHPTPQHPYNPRLLFDDRMQHPAPSHDDHRDYMDGQRGYPPDIRRGFDDSKLPRGIDTDRRSYQEGRDGRRAYPDERRRGMVEDDLRSRREEEDRRRFEMEEGRRKFSDEDLQRRREEDERFRKGGSDHRRGGGSARRDYSDVHSEDQRQDRREGDRRGDERDRRSGEDREDRHGVDERRMERSGDERRIDERRGDERRGGDERRNTGDERRGDDERKGDRRGGMDSRRSDERKGEDRRGNEEKRSGRHDSRRDEGRDRKRDTDRDDYALKSKTYDSPNRNRRASPVADRKEKEKESSRKERYSDRRGKETDKRDRDHSKKGRDSEVCDKERHGDRYDDVGSRERERDGHKSHERGNSQTKNEDKEERKRRKRKEKGQKDGRKSSSREKDFEMHESGNEEREEKAEKKKDKKRKKKEKRRDSQTSNDGSQIDGSGDESEKKKRKRRERKARKDKVRIDENAEAEWAAEAGEMEITGKENSAPVENENSGPRLLETLPAIQRTPVHDQVPPDEGNEGVDIGDSVKEGEVVQGELPVDVHVPELSRWERDEEATSTPKALASSKTEDDEKKVTTEVLKRAENALFSKGMSGRGLTQRKVYMDQQKQREAEVRSPTPEWEKAETREAKRRGPSIQITISSKYESQIGRPRLSRNNEPTSELADRLPARDRLGPKLDLVDEKSGDDRRPQSPRNSRSYRKDDLHVHHREMDRRRSRSRSVDRRNRDRRPSRSPSPRSRRGSSMSKNKKYDDQNGYRARSRSKETEVQAKKGKKRDLSTDEDLDTKKIKSEETAVYNETESTEGEILKTEVPTDIDISTGVLEDIVKRVTPPLIPTVNEAYLASVSAQSALGTVNGTSSAETKEEVKAEKGEEVADVQSNNEHTDIANEFKPPIEPPSLSNPELFPGLDMRGASTLSPDQSFALDDNITLPEPTIRRRFSPILPPSSPKPSGSDIKGKAKEKAKVLKRKRRKHSSSSSSSSESSSSSSDSSSEDDDKKKKKKKRKKKKKKKYLSSSDSSENDVKTKKKKKKDKKKKKKKEKKKKNVKKE